MHSSNYTPLQNLSNNIADLVNDSARWHFNVISLQLNTLENFTEFDSDAPQYIKSLGFSSINKLMSNINDKAYIQGKVIFPSVSYKIDQKNTIAFSMGLRANGIYGVSHDNVGQFFSSDNSSNVSLNNEWLTGIVQAWTEYGLSYARKIKTTDKYAISAGVTLKLIQSGGSGYVEFSDLNATIKDETIQNFSVNLTYGVNSELYNISDDGKITFRGSTGLGVDIGISYIRKSNQAYKPYLYKLAFSANDIGGINNKSRKNVTRYKISITDVPYSRFNNIQTLDALIDSIETSVDIEKTSSKSFKQNLPIHYNLYFDYCFKPNWYINTVFSYKVNNYKNLIDKLSKDITSLTITPRYEKKKWGVYVPITHHSNLGFFGGLSARWKFIFLGSCVSFSNFINQETDKTEFYFGIDIPIGKVQ